MSKQKKNKKLVIKIKKRRSRLSSFLKIIKSDLNKLSEDRLIDDAIYCLEDKLLELNLTNINDLLLLKDEFQLQTNKLLKDSKKIVNLIIYFISSNYDKYNKCGNKYSTNYLSSNFDQFLDILFKDDFSKNLDKNQEIKTTLIKLTKLLNSYELQIAYNNLRREEKLKSNDKLIIDQMNIHESDLLEFKSLAQRLDNLVGKHSALRMEAAKFKTEVANPINQCLINNLKIFLDEFDSSLNLIDLQSDLEVMLTKYQTKSTELLHKKEIKLIYDDLKKLENNEQIEKKTINEHKIEQKVNKLIDDVYLTRLKDELELLNKQIEVKREEINLKRKDRNNLMDNKLDENALLLEHKSKDFRQITESFILERKLICDIKRLLIKMCKLIDTRFKVIYPNLNENQFFKNEIDEYLNFDLIVVLDHFANERDVREKINKKKLDEEEENKKNSTNEDTKDELTGDKNLDETIDNEKDDNAKVNLDETNCTDVKVR